MTQKLAISDYHIESSVIMLARREDIAKETRAEIEEIKRRIFSRLEVKQKPHEMKR